MVQAVAERNAPPTRVAQGFQIGVSLVVMAKLLQPRVGAAAVPLKPVAPMRFGLAGMVSLAL